MSRDFLLSQCKFAPLSAGHRRVETANGGVRALYPGHQRQSARANPIGAFFDFDGTIIASHSIKDMFIERLKNGEVTSQEIYDLGAMIPRYPDATPTASRRR